MIERSTRLKIKHYGVFLSSMGPGLPEIQSTISAALIPLNPLRDFLPMFESHTIRSQYTTLMRGSISHSFATCFNLLKLTMALGVASYFDDWIMVIDGNRHHSWFIYCLYPHHFPLSCLILRAGFHWFLLLFLPRVCCGRPRRLRTGALDGSLFIKKIFIIYLNG
jgi:hypothetical protein